MTGRLRAREHTGPPVEIDTAALIDARDELAAIRDLLVCLNLACSSPILPRDERAGLSQLGVLLRESIEALVNSLDQLIPPR